MASRLIFFGSGLFRSLYQPYHHPIMAKNVGTADIIIRLLIAVAAAVLIFTKTITGTWAIVLGIVGVVMLLTALAGRCGLYALLGISTCPMKKADGGEKS